ncbi:hypothetical protein VTK73DRAFT_9509 [Phialemonium thermophilum]|uniref:Secreted protein n=1 Tax=Phialemonium thermophilum TaxID=223376 RepID=A0ABR3Y4A8_9PEZI
MLTFGLQAFFSWPCQVDLIASTPLSKTIIVAGIRANAAAAAHISVREGDRDEDEGESHQPGIRTHSGVTPVVARQCLSWQYRKTVFVMASVPAISATATTPMARRNPGVRGTS